MTQEYFSDLQEVLTAAESSENGLSPSNAAKRLEAHGPNKLDEGKKKTLLQKIWAQIKDPMILVLAAAGIISGAFGEIADMVIILIVVVLNTILGIYQEGKAEKALEALQKMSAPHSKVRRNGAVNVIPSDEIVTGDIILLEAGDAVPADLRLISASSLKVEEAALTGESVPVEKTTAPIARQEKEIPLGDRTNMAYMGTNVTYGHGEGVVTATGMNTEMGKIANILSGTNDEKTPLQKKLASLSKVLSVAVLGICVFIFLFSVFRAGGFKDLDVVFESLLTAVSLAVAAIPEGLVVVVTVLLSIGVTKMSSRNAIIRRLTAVETLGCTEVICSDKTGTLTQNKMTVVDHFGDEKQLAIALSLCNDTNIDSEGNLVGDPTETALVDYAQKLGLSELRAKVGRLADAPFDSERKMMSTLHNINGSIMQFTKGAADEILKRCDTIYLNGKEAPLTDELKKEILNKNKEFADKALRVLGAALKDHSALPADTSPDALEKGMTFIGLVGMIDPVRPEVLTAIENCVSAGIRPIMITGDHKDTAVAIAKDLKILTDPSQAITGAELSELSDEEFEKRIGEICVYARVQPEHKVRIVKMWKSKGKITAMTGDGVNDAPALKSADIGVGMGITGTDVTKNVSDMVLADDNFASIIYAVEEGRRIYENIRKAIQFLLASNLSEVFSIFIATLFGWKLFAPIHILWINLITDTFPAMALGMERAEPDAMKKPPRDPKESIFANKVGLEIIWQGVFIGILTLISYGIGNAQNHLTGMTMAFLTLSMCEIFHSLNMRSRTRSVFNMGYHNKHLLLALAASFVLTIAVIYIPVLNGLFKLTALPIYDLLTAVGLALVIVPIVEIYKLFKRKFPSEKSGERNVTH